MLRVLLILMLRVDADAATLLLIIAIRHVIEAS